MHLRATKGGPKEEDLDVGQREGSNMHRVENKTRSKQLLLTDDPHSLGTPLAPSRTPGAARRGRRSAPWSPSLYLCGGSSSSSNNNNNNNINNNKRNTNNNTNTNNYSNDK